MESADTACLRRVRNFRLIAVAFALAVLAVAIFASAPADAQSLSVNPSQRHQRANADGDVLGGFYYKAADSDFLHHLRIHFVPGRYDAVGPATYRDFGRLELFFESTSRTNLHPGTAVRSGWWFTADGTALAACNDDTHRCRISKTEYQALAGQTGAGDDAVIGPILVGFKIPSSVSGEQIVLQSKHDTSHATRTSTSNQWQNSRWTRVDKHRAIVAALTADGEVIPEYVFSNADGNLGDNLVHVRISVGGSHIPGFESATYERWGTANNAGTYLRINGEISGSMTNLVGGQAANAFFKADGTTPLGCNSSTSNDCRITKDVWKAMAGQAGEPDTVQIKPIRIAFKVPSADSGGTDFATTPETVTLNLNRIGAQNDQGVGLFTGSRVVNTDFTRMIGHIFRLQAASRVDGTNARTPLEPGDPLPDGSSHSATWCRPTSTGTDCTRDLEVGEDMYVASILTRGGTADTTGRWNRTGSAWLQYGFDHFDEIEISFTPTVGAGGGDVVISGGTLCPVEIPAGSPEHPFVDAPRDRYAEELRVCKWNHAYYGNAYRSAANPSGAPYWDSGTGPQVVGIKAGTGDLAVTYRKDGADVATNKFTLTIAAATRANLLSAADAPLITAGIGQADGGGPLTLRIGYERRRGIPAFWPMTRDTAGSGYYGFARYQDVESVALTVPAGGGTLDVLGTGRSCTAGSAECTITLGKGDLKLAARYGYTPADGAPGIADSDAIWRTRLLLHGAASRDVTISGVLTLSSGTPNTHSFSYTAKAAPNAAGATVAAYLRGDSDGILAPGQSAAITVGYQIPAWVDRPASGNGGFLGKFAEENAKNASVLLTESATENEDLDGSAIQVLPARQSDWVWTTYSAGETDFEVNPADQVWLGADAPPLSYRYSPVPGTWAITEEGYTRTFATPVPAGDVDYIQPGVMTDAYLQITGPATWTETGGKRLRLDYSDYTHVKCVNSATLNANLEGRTCYVVDAAGNAPSITVDSGASGDIRITADLPLYVLVGAAPNDRGPTLLGNGLGRPSNTHALRRTSAFGSAIFKVDSIAQLDAVSLARTPDGNGVTQSGPIAIGSSRSGVRLALRNANGQPSQLSAVSSITVTVVGGGTLTGLGCTNAVSCTLSAASGPLFDAVKANPRKTAEIDLTFNAPSTPGDASVRASVVGTDGATFAETLELTISGSAAELAVGAELPRVHSSATDNDDRDRIVIPISARDVNGNPAPMPRNAAAEVLGVGGAALPSGSHTSTIKCEGGDDITRLRCQIEIVITASASQPLASGAYTARVTGTGISRTDVGFAVGGPAETLSLAIPDALPNLAQTFTATVSVVDKAGVPVADGTWVQFSTAATGGGNPSAVVTSPAEADVDHDNDADTATVKQRRAQTKNGEASANITIVGNGISVLTASANNKQDSEPLDTRAAAAVSAEPAGPVLVYNTQSGQATTSSWATYRGAAATTADELIGHAEAPATASIVWLWNGVEWIRYGEVDGNPLPGSQPFFILPDDTIWFGD